MTYEQIKELACQLELEGVVLFHSPSYDSAFLGFSVSENRACYSLKRMIEYLVTEEEMTEEEAREFIDYNTIGSLGNSINGLPSPIIIDDESLV